MADVARQLGATTGGVDADNGRPRERRSAEPEQVLGAVVEENPDVGFWAKEYRERREEVGVA